jgi:hypothetical protein
MADPNTNPHDEYVSDKPGKKLKQKDYLLHTLGTTSPGAWQTQFKKNFAAALDEIFKRLNKDGVTYDAELIAANWKAIISRK